MPVEAQVVPVFGTISVFMVILLPGTPGATSFERFTGRGRGDAHDPLILITYFVTLALFTTVNVEAREAILRPFTRLEARMNLHLPWLSFTFSHTVIRVFFDIVPALFEVRRVTDLRIDEKVFIQIPIVTYLDFLFGAAQLREVVSSTVSEALVPPFTKLGQFSVNRGVVEEHQRCHHRYGDEEEADKTL